MFRQALYIKISSLDDYEIGRAMISNTEVKISFEGRFKEFQGNFLRRSRWDALKIGARAWAICWAISLAFVFIPYVNVSVFLIFIPLGPMVLTVIYFVSKRTIKSIDGVTECVECARPITIHEINVTPPIYESCPTCNAGFEIIVPSES